MRKWDCGSTACIAGWALRLSGYTREGVYSSPSNAARLLGIQPKQAKQLFLATELGDRTEDTVRFIHTKLDEWYPGWREEKGTL